MVFKTGRAGQPPAWKVRFLRRSVAKKVLLVGSFCQEALKANGELRASVRSPQTALCRDSSRSRADRAALPSARQSSYMCRMASTDRRRHVQGIVARHGRNCASRAGSDAEGDCDCDPSYQAQAYSVRDRRTIRRTFGTLSEARAWRPDAQVAMRRGVMRASTRTTLQETAPTGLPPRRLASSAPARATLTSPRRSAAIGRRFEPRSCRRSARAASQRSRATTSRTSSTCLMAGGRAPSTVRNTILPLRAIYSPSPSTATATSSPATRPKPLACSTATSTPL